MTRILYPEDPGYGDAGGHNATFLAAALAWAADPTNGSKKTTMTNAYTAELTAHFTAVGVAISLHQDNGTDTYWGSCRTEAAATWTAAGLNAYLALPTVLP